jgi:hypothetical protein
MAGGRMPELDVLPAGDRMSEMRVAALRSRWPN